MRIAHATDIHFTEDPSLLQLPGKRLLGTANLWLRGRRHDFPELIQQCLVDHLVALEPDLLIITGDLTAQALPSEFEKAKRFLLPALTRQPSVVMAGNHDVYTRGAARDDRIHEHFAAWLHRDGPIGRFVRDSIEVITLDPNRPTGIHASGLIPESQLEALAEALAEPSERVLVLALHYPIVDRRGDVYDGEHHGLLNARALIEVLAQGTRAPDLILHGHEHHGFQQLLTAGDHAIPIVNCGSSGYRFMPDKRRAAGMCVYELAPGVPLSIERYLHDGERFVPEQGGAFATGR